MQPRMLLQVDGDEDVAEVTVGVTGAPGGSAVAAWDTTEAGILPVVSITLPKAEGGTDPVVLALVCDLLVAGLERTEGDTLPVVPAFLP